MLQEVAAWLANWTTGHKAIRATIARPGALTGAHWPCELKDEQLRSTCQQGTCVQRVDGIDVTCVYTKYMYVCRYSIYIYIYIHVSLY